MMTLDEKFKALEADNAPGQEVRQEIGDLNAIMRGGKFGGIPVDFSHGDVDAFPPFPGSTVLPGSPFILMVSLVMSQQTWNGVSCFPLQPSQSFVCR